MESSNSPRKMFSPNRLTDDNSSRAFEQYDFLSSTIDCMSTFDKKYIGYSVDRPSSKIANEITALG